MCFQDVGCDYGIDSNAVEDRCGVCLGDGKSCEMVYKSFDEEEGLGESRTKDGWDRLPEKQVIFHRQCMKT